MGLDIRSTFIILEKERETQWNTVHFAVPIWLRAPFLFAECGKELPSAKTEPKQTESGKKQTSKKKSSKKKSKKVPVTPEPEVIEDGYDGYYNDVLPSDEGRRREGIDKELVKKISIILVCLFAIIALCVVLMYVL